MAGENINDSTQRTDSIPARQILPLEDKFVKKVEQVNAQIQNEIKKGVPEPSQEKKSKPEQVKYYSYYELFNLKKEVEERTKLEEARALQKGLQAGQDKEKLNSINKQIGVLEKKYDKKVDNQSKIEELTKEIAERNKYNELLLKKGELEKALKTKEFGEKTYKIGALEAIIRNDRPEIEEPLPPLGEKWITEPKTKDDIENELKTINKKIEPFEKEYGIEPPEKKPFTGLNFDG